MKVILESHTNFRAKAGLQPISYDDGLGETLIGQISFLAKEEEQQRFV